MQISHIMADLDVAATIAKKTLENRWVRPMVDERYLQESSLLVLTCPLKEEDIP